MEVGQKRESCPPHYWFIDSRNVGRCKYCGEVRDFGRLLRKNMALAEGKASKDGRRGKGKVRNPYGRRGKPH